MRCTGACCTHFTLWDEGRQLGGRALREVLLHRAVSAEEIRVRQILIPVIGSDEYFTCNELREGRCGNYDARPLMCRDYPNGDTCRSCGARSDQEARGVALMLASR